LKNSRILILAKTGLRQGFLCLATCFLNGCKINGLHVDGAFRDHAHLVSTYLDEALVHCQRNRSAPFAHTELTGVNSREKRDVARQNVYLASSGRHHHVVNHLAIDLLVWSYDLK